jgi:hypothetical protein
MVKVIVVFDTALKMDFAFLRAVSNRIYVTSGAEHHLPSSIMPTAQVSRSILFIPRLSA